VFDGVGVGGVERVGATGRRAVVDAGTEGAPHETALGLFELQLGGAHQPAAMADAAVADGELLHHAVAVEPVVVALAAALMQRRAVAVEAAAQPRRPAAAHRGFGLQVAGGVADALHRAQQRLTGEGSRELIGPRWLGQCRCGKG